MLIDHTGKIEWGEVDMSATRSIFADALSTKAAVDFL
jgi:hypothetical protein